MFFSRPDCRLKTNKDMGLCFKSLCVFCCCCCTRALRIFFRVSLGGNHAVSFAKIRVSHQGLTRVSLTGAFHDLLAKLRICCYGSTTTFIVKNAILKPKLNGLMYFELWFYFAFKSKQKWNQQIINKKKF